MWYPDITCEQVGWDKRYTGSLISRRGELRARV